MRIYDGSSNGTLKSAVSLNIKLSLKRAYVRDFLKEDFFLLFVDFYMEFKFDSCWDKRI